MFLNVLKEAEKNPKFSNRQSSASSRTLCVQAFGTQTGPEGLRSRRCDVIVLWFSQKRREING